MKDRIKACALSGRAETPPRAPAAGSNTTGIRRLKLGTTVTLIRVLPSADDSLNQQTIRELIATIFDVPKNGHEESLIIDLTHVEWATAQLLNVIAAARDHLARHRSQLTLIGVSKQCAELLHASGLSESVRCDRATKEVVGDMLPLSNS